MTAITLSETDAHLSYVLSGLIAVSVRFWLAGLRLPCPSAGAYACRSIIVIRPEVSRWPRE